MRIATRITRQLRGSCTAFGRLNSPPVSPCGPRKALGCASDRPWEFSRLQRCARCLYLREETFRLDTP